MWKKLLWISPLLFTLCGCWELLKFDEYEATSTGSTSSGGELCEPGSEETCYTGPPGTDGIGLCKVGMRVCNAEGTGFGKCFDEVTPKTEDCATDDDEDCDGATLDTDAGCICHPLQQGSCYTGSADTEGVGNCKPGVGVCAASGTEFTSCTNDVTPKAEICLSNDDENCDGEPACTGAHRWSAAFGNDSGQAGIDVAVDSTGNVLVTGYFEGTIDFGGGPLASAGQADIFVAKFDGAGNHIWSKRFGNPGNESVEGIAVDSDGALLLCGGFEGAISFGGELLTCANDSAMFVTKLDAAGSHLWSKRFETNDMLYYVACRDIAVDSESNALLTGSFGASVDFGGGVRTSAGSGDIFVAKFDAAGEHVWSKRFGDASDQSGYSIAVDNVNSVLITGYVYGGTDFGGGTLTAKGDKSDAMIVKLDSVGNHLWSKMFGDYYFDAGTGIALDGDDVLMVGFFEKSIALGGETFYTEQFGGGYYGTDRYVVKFNGAGGHVWSKAFPKSGFGDRVVVDSVHNVLIVGQLGEEADFGGGLLMSKGNWDTCAAKFNADGNYLWSKGFGSANEDQVRNVAVDGAGNVLVTGFLGGPVDFGGGPLAYSAGRDIFVAKLAP